MVWLCQIITRFFIVCKYFKSHFFEKTQNELIFLRNPFPFRSARKRKRQKMKIAAKKDFAFRKENATIEKIEKRKDYNENL